MGRTILKEVAIVDPHRHFWETIAANPASSTDLASSLERNTAFLTMHGMEQESERCHLDALASHLKTPVMATLCDGNWGI